MSVESRIQSREFYHDFANPELSRFFIGSQTTMGSQLVLHVITEATLKHPSVGGLNGNFKLGMWQGSHKERPPMTPIEDCVGNNIAPEISPGNNYTIHVDTFYGVFGSVDITPNGATEGIVYIKASWE